MSSKSKSSTPTLKQSKLSFGASKSTAAVNKAKEARTVSEPPSLTSKRPRRTAATKPSFVDIESSDEGPNVDDIELAKSEPSSESEIEKDDEEKPSAQKLANFSVPAVTKAREAKASRLRMKAEAAESPSKLLDVLVGPRKGEFDQKDVEELAESRPKLNIKNRAYDRISREAKGRMAYAKTIHPTTEVDGEDLPLNRVDDILRLFDLNYDYGPCVGMTRLQRWQRANKLGLNPPSEIYDILMTREGLTETRYVQNVLFGRV